MRSERHSCSKHALLQKAVIIKVKTERCPLGVAAHCTRRELQNCLFSILLRSRSCTICYPTPFLFPLQSYFILSFHFQNPENPWICYGELRCFTENDFDSDISNVYFLSITVYVYVYEQFWTYKERNGNKRLFWRFFTLSTLVFLKDMYD